MHNINGNKHYYYIKRYKLEIFEVIYTFRTFSFLGLLDCYNNEAVIFFNKGGGKAFKSSYYLQLSMYS